MIKRGLALRYAKAQFNADFDQNNLEKKLVFFELVAKFLKENPNLIKFLEAPQIDQEEKRKTLKTLFKDRLDEDFYHFTYYLIEKRRLRYFDQISQEYRLMVNQHLGIWEAKIITAVAIDPQSENSLKEKLESYYKKKIKLNKEIDPKIIGGAILIVANEMIDWSVSERLKKMKENLMENVV